MRWAKKIRLALASLMVLVLQAPIGPAQASTMSVRLVTFGVNNSITSPISFVVEFSGGAATNAPSCSALGHLIEPNLSLTFVAAGSTTEVPAATLAYTDKSVTNLGLTCQVTTNAALGFWEETVESVPVQMSLTIGGLAPISHTGTLINPRFRGVLRIDTPTKGQSINGYAALRITAIGANGTKPDFIRVRACRVSECEVGLDHPVELYPALSRDRMLSIGYVGLDEDDQYVMNFSATGLIQIDVSAQFAGVWNNQRVLVNVLSTMRQTSVPWVPVADLIANNALQAGLQIDCGRGYLSPGKSLLCTLSFDNPSALTTAPIYLATSTNGASFKHLATVDVRTDQTKKVIVPVAKTVNTLKLFAAPLGAPEAYVTQTVTVAPPALKLSAPASVRSGKAFKFTLTIDAKNSMRCVLYRDEPRLALAYFQIESGSVASTAVLKLSSSLARQESAMLFVVCYPGNGQLEARRPIKITR